MLDDDLEGEFREVGAGGGLVLGTLGDSVFLLGVAIMTN